MSHKIICYPLGNADTSLLELKNEKKILIDYAHMKDPNDEDDKRCDLPAELSKVVKGDFDVVVFTHADRDHINRFSEYFYLEHADKYQNESRKKINDLWVPAAIILETELDNPEAKILRAEARYRLKNKKRIKVFSKPDKLKDWLKSEGISFDDVKHLIVNAGELVPGWTLAGEGIEFFVHAPFSEHVDDKDIERNEACIIMQATFNNSYNSKVIFGADACSDLWDDIVKVTKYYKRESRLEWDVFHISHHSSYTAINKDDRGKTKTKPTDNVKWLMETQSKDKCKLISPSWEIPDNTGETQPPHKEAANYYEEDVAEKKNGEYRVSMEHPNKVNPAPMEIKIDDTGVTIIKTVIPAAFVSQRTPPRAG